MQYNHNYYYNITICMYVDVSVAHCIAYISVGGRDYILKAIVAVVFSKSDCASACGIMML